MQEQNKENFRRKLLSYKHLGRRAAPNWRIGANFGGLFAHLST